MLKRVTLLVRNYPHQETLDEDDIIKYIYTKDSSMRRQNEKNLRRFVSTGTLTFRLVIPAINSIKEENQKTNESSESDLEEGIELMQVNDTNFMNRSLLSVYKPKQEENNAANTTNTNISSESTAADTPPTDEKSKKRSRPDTYESKKKSKNATKWDTPSTRLGDLAGIDSIIEEILQLIGMPLKHPEIYLHLGIQPPRGILLHGPSGCGKTMLANAIAGVPYP
jgi:ribosome biogenesis ATPase